MRLLILRDAEFFGCRLPCRSVSDIQVILSGTQQLDITSHRHLSKGQEIIWKLTEQLWEKRNPNFPDLPYNKIGLVRSCGLAKYETDEGKPKSGENRLWKILISEAGNLIWKIRCERVIQREGKEDLLHTEQDIQNRFVAIMNKRLLHDKLLTNTSRYRQQAIPRARVLATWANVLNEDTSKAPDDWIIRGN